jgi:hypothetical protein
MEKTTTSSIINIADKRLRFLRETIVKISSPSSDFAEEIIRCLSVAFEVKPTSAIMYNTELKQFFVFLSLSQKEVA